MRLMKVLQVVLMMFALSLPLYSQINQNHSYLNIGKELVEKLIDIKWHQNDFEKFLKQDIKQSNVEISIRNFSENQIKNISDRIYFIDLQYKYKGSNWIAQAYRLMGIASGANDKQIIFYDSGIYMPECGGDFFRSAGNLSSMIINGSTLLIFHEINRTVVCDPVSTEEKIVAKFYNVSRNYQKVYEVETKYVNYGDSDNDPEPASIRSTFFYENMCADSCKAITFWFFENRKLNKVQTLTLNKSGDQLIPYRYPPE